jgi:hypothetical protein
MQTNTRTRSTAASRRQFSLRSVAVVIALVCLFLAVAGLKWRQDERRTEAMAELQQMGFQATIGSSDGRPATWLRFTKSEFADRDLERCLLYVGALTYRHDLGASKGLEVKLLDFTDCNVSAPIIAAFQSRFPDAEVRHGRASR